MTGPGGRVTAEGKTGLCEKRATREQVKDFAGPFSTKASKLRKASILKSYFFEFLTPAHFIANGSVFTVPETPVDDKLSLKSKWKYLQQTVQANRKRWVVEYLNNLTLRHKWKKSIYNPKENLLVYITDINTASLSYPIGHIVSLLSSSDGVVRSVSIKVNNKTP